MNAPRRVQDRGDRDEGAYRKQPAKHTDAAPPRRPQLNEYWIDKEGINREVLQAEICKYLGAEATCRPGDYQGTPGYKIKALRPFTPEMLEDLRAASSKFSRESSAYQQRNNRDLSYQDSATYEKTNMNVDYPDNRTGVFAGRNESPSYGGPGYPVPPQAGGYPVSTGAYTGTSTYAVHPGISATSPMPQDPRYGAPEYRGYPPVDARGDPRHNGAHQSYGGQYPPAGYSNETYRGQDPRADPRMPPADYYLNAQYPNARDTRMDTGYYDQASGTNNLGGYPTGPGRAAMSPQYDTRTPADPYRGGGAGSGGGGIDPRYRR